MSKKILLIIRSPQLQKPCFDFLKEMGYLVKLCPDPKTSIEMVTNFSPDLILCEASLPVISGQELAKLFKSHERFSTIPFIMLVTKMPSIKELERADSKIMIDDLLVMPFNQTSFYGMISKWLESDERPLTIAERMAGQLAVDQSTRKQADKSPARVVKPVKSWKKGKISLVSLVRLAFNIIQNKESGVLVVRGARRRMRVLIKSAMVMDVISNFIRDDAFGRFLIKTSKITNAEADASLKRAKKMNSQQGRMLVKMGILTDEELIDSLSQQKSLKVLNLFSEKWLDAHFEFTPKAATAPADAMRPEPLCQILKIGIVTVAQTAEIMEVFLRNRRENSTFVLDANFYEIAAMLKLDQNTILKAQAIEGQTLSSIQKALPEKFENLLRIAFLLVSIKALRFSDQTPNAKRQPTPPEKPTFETPPPAPQQKPEPIQKPKPAIPNVQAAPKAVKLDAAGSKSFHQYMSQARVHVDELEYLTARPLLEAALQFNPESSEALTLLGFTVFMVDGQNDPSKAIEAKEMLKKAISLDDRNDLAYLFLGKIFKSEQKDILASSHFKRALDLNPANDEADREVKLAEVKRRKQKGFAFRD